MDVKSAASQKRMCAKCDQFALKPMLALLFFANSQGNFVSERFAKLNSQPSFESL